MNRIELLRQRLPQEKAFTNLSSVQIYQPVEYLNLRLRTVLGLRSLNEVMYGMQMRYTLLTVPVVL